MISLKGFFRKKKTKIYFKLFSIVTIIIMLLNSIYNYVDYESNKLKQESSSFLMYTKENHDELLRKEKGIKSYRQALSFEIGLDNDIIYDPKTVVDEDGNSKYEEEFDETKILWSNLLFGDDILTFKANSCGTNLSDNEVIIYLSERFYNKEYLENYIEHEIIFKYNNQEIPLIIKDILEPKTFNYVCVSDNLYNKLLKTNKNYIYDIETVNYKIQEKLEKKWNNLEDNDFFRITIPFFPKESDTIDRNDLLDNMIMMFKVANVVSTVIFIIMLLAILKDLVSDEESNMLLLKQLGYNKWQNILSLLKNVFVLNMVSLIFSLLFYIIIALGVNLVFKISLSLLNFKLIILYLVIIILIEFIYIYCSLKHINYLKKD